MDFSLIELLVVLTIIAILSAIAIPIYNNYLLCAHRSDATTSITTIALNEEEYRLNNNTYTTTLNHVWDTAQQLALVLLDANGNPTTDTSNATGFRTTATPTDIQTNDTECSPIALSVNSGAITKTPERCR